MTAENVKRYLARIGLLEIDGPTLIFLQRLQEAHLMTVPFENVDIYNKKPIDLSKTYTKVVEKRRGGFCYELNGLFFDLLKSAGFDVRMISARVADKEGKFGPEFDHLALIVSIGEYEYLVDVGFGEFSLNPLPVILDKSLSDPAGVFRFEKYDGDYLVVKKRDEQGVFVSYYIFQTIERRMEEFYGMCIFHQTSSESHFTKGLICSMPTESGRITLTGNFLKETRDGVASKTFIQTEEIEAMLKEIFGITTGK